MIAVCSVTVVVIVAVLVTVAGLQAANSKILVDKKEILNYSSCNPKTFTIDV